MTATAVSSFSIALGRVEFVRIAGSYSQNRAGSHQLWWQAEDAVREEEHQRDRGGSSTSVCILCPGAIKINHFQRILG